MVVLGLLLLLAAAAVTLVALTSNAKVELVEVFGQDLLEMSSAALFLAGAATAVVAALGLFLIFGGAARARRRRVQRKTQMKNSKQEAAALQAEKDRLQAELANERARRTEVSTTAYPEEHHTGTASLDRTERMDTQSVERSGVIYDDGPLSRTESDTVVHRKRVDVDGTTERGKGGLFHR